MSNAPDKTKVVIALGANLPSRFGLPHDTLLASHELIAALAGEVLVISPEYETEPIPVSDDPWYLNQVVVIETILAPHELLKILQQIESDIGRVQAVKNAPRVIDLDIIAYGDSVVDDVGLTIPHPRLSERAFVLLPLRDILPNWRHPVSKLLLGELITDLIKKQNVRKISH